MNFLLSIEAETKNGKSTVAYTAPLPIVGLDFDMSAEGAIHGTKYKLFEDAETEFINYTGDLDEAVTKIKAIKNNDILIFRMPPTMQVNFERLVDNVDKWAFTQGVVSAAQRNTLVSTIVVDTMGGLRELAADAYLERLQGNSKDKRSQLIQIEWGKPNGSTSDIYKTSRGAMKNLVATHHLADEYQYKEKPGGNVVSEPSGKRALEGHKKTYELVDAAIRLIPIQVDVLGSDKKEKGLEGKFNISRYNPDLENTSLINPSWDSLIRRTSDSLDGRLKFDYRSKQ